MDIAKIIKKNIAIIIPAAIAVVAILLFVPTILMRGKINDKLEQSKRAASEVDSAIYSVVPLRQYEVVKEYQDRHEQDANEIKNLAVQTTQRELLSYKIFPEPNETSVQIFNEFKKAYKTAFIKLIKDMNALDAPSDIEIRNEAGANAAATMGSDRQLFSSSSRTDTSKSDSKIIELLCKRRSKEIPVYANPQVFSGVNFWDNWEYSGVQNAVLSCWYCQLACWIHKDIVDTINQLNAGSTSVAESSVKRLLGVRFDSADAGGRSNTTNNMNAIELPGYVKDGGKQLCQPWTQRISNDKIDIIHFSVAVIVRADDVLKFMGALCSEKEHYFSGYNGEQDRQLFKHNQITVLQTTILPVDRQALNHERYVYGEDAVVHLNLICEYLLIREGYDAIKPMSLKEPAAIPGQEQQGMY